MIQKFKETHDSIYTYQKDLDNACFQHDVVYGDFKDLPRITASDKVLHDRAYLTLLKIRNTMDIKEVLLQLFTNWFIMVYKSMLIF